MIAIGKVYVISSRYKQLRVAVYKDKNLNEDGNDLVKGIPFLVLEHTKARYNNFYYIKGLIGDQIGYFRLEPEKVEEII